MMLAAVEQQQQKRFPAFQLTDYDLSRLEASADFVQLHLPELLEKLHSNLDDWPEIQEALTIPEIREARLAHWLRVASGCFNEGFLESAEHLAELFLQYGVPAFGMTTSHSSIAAGIYEAIEADAMRKVTWFSSRRARENLGTYRDALFRAVWFDQEILLECYAKAERRSRKNNKIIALPVSWSGAAL